MLGQVKLGRDGLWCCAFHQQGRLARLFLARGVSRIHRFVCLSDHLHLACFPKLTNHVSTTTNLTMMSGEKMKDWWLCSQAKFYTVHSNPTPFSLNLSYDSRHWEQGLPGF